MNEVHRATLYPVLPLRDIVVFPHMIVPLFVGREKSVRALEDVMKDDKQVLLATQKNAAQDDPQPEDIYTVGTIGTVLQLLKLPDGTVKVLIEGGQRARISNYAENAAFFQAYAEPVADSDNQGKEVEALARSVVSQFEQYIKLNKKIPPEVLVSINQIEDPEQARRHGRLPSRPEDRREAGAAGDPERRPSPRARLRLHGRRDRRAAGGEAHPQPRQAPDGEDPARVLSERAAEGDPEGAGRRRRSPRRAGRGGAAHPQDQALQGGAREGAGRGQEAALHEPDVRRGDGGAQLPRLGAGHSLEQADQGEARHPGGAEGAERRPLRSRQGQGAHPRISCRAAAHEEGEGADPLPGRRARRRQDLARQVDRAGHGPQFRPHVAGRRARRGGDPRPPAHLYRLHARQGAAGHEEGEVLEPAVPARRDRQARRRLAGRSLLGPAGGAGSGAEFDLQRPLSRGRLRSVRRDVRHHGEHAAHAPAAARPHGDHPHPRLYRG